MKDILVNNFKKELIVYGVRPDLGAKALICNKAKKCIELGKRVLFYSFELPEQITLQRINANDDSNLLIKDKPLNNLSEIKDTIESFKPDIIFIDYFQLMTRDVKIEDIHMLNAYAKQYDIPIIVLSQIGMIKFKNVEFTNLNLEKFIQICPILKPITDISDRFIVFYKKAEKEYMLKEIKNIYGETQEFDIRELLN